MVQERVSNSSHAPKATLPLWTSGEIQQATQGDVLHEFQATNVVIDSRNVTEGDLFVALQGPQFDGHDYVAAALKAGAAGALVSRIPAALSRDAPLVVVPDVLGALNDLARAARARSKAKIIGITGSFGKTSMKEALRHVLSKEGCTLATERSFNNHWGLPLTLSRLHPDHQYAVIEMGMNNPGEIAGYSYLVQPHIALITNTGEAHIGKMGTLWAIAQAKAEIFQGLVPGGQAILWAEDAHFKAHSAEMKEQHISCVSFGEQADFSVSSLLTPEGLEVSVTQGGETLSIVLSTVAAHWAQNCAALSAALDGVGVQWGKALKAMQTFSFPQGRGNIIHTEAGITVIDESYNAAPTTMKYAIHSLDKFGHMTKKRTLAILGDMLEVGPESAQYHKALASVEGFQNISKVYCCGIEMQSLYEVLPEYQKGHWAENPQDLLSFVLADVQNGDTYLIKGSRGQWAARGRMSVFVDALERCCPSYNSEQSETL